MATLMQVTARPRYLMVLAMAGGEPMPSHSPSPSSARAAPQALPRRPRRILLVDDEPEMLVLMKEVLQRAFPGTEVHTTERGRDALAMAQERAYDVIVSDYRMPGLNGLEVLFQAPSSRRILMTAYADKSLKQKAQAAGVDFLEKAGDPQSIVEAVGRALGQA